MTTSNSTTNSSEAFTFLTKSRRKSRVNYLNDFHRRNSEGVQSDISSQPNTSLAEAMAQYDRIKRESMRDSRQDRNGGKHT